MRVPDPTVPKDPALPAAIGRYEILCVLGEGAMGRVLRAHDPVLDRDVALKHLRGDLRIPSDLRRGLLARMGHEARAAARVPHPHLVQLHDMGDDPAVGLYLVFELVEGRNLKQQLAEEGRLPPAQVAELAVDLGSALTVTHEAGILHRDVKPENVMLSPHGGKIADFGIARIPDSTLTQQGGLMGTPAYSAPETFRGGAHSAASDQFSFAATIYEALCGRRAFPGEDAVTVAAAIQHDDPPPFAAALGLPRAVDQVLARGLARRPEARYPSCLAFGEALARALTLPVIVEPAAPIVVAPPAEAAPAPLPDPPRRTSQVLLGAAVVVATAALLVQTALHRAEAEARAAASASAQAARPPDPPRPSARPRPSAGPNAGAVPAR
jgi:serine/threonine-protein kinase